MIRLEPGFAAFWSARTFAVPPQPNCLTIMRPNRGFPGSPEHFHSFGFGWFGILRLRLNLPKEVAVRTAVKSFWRRLVRHVDRGQGECPVLKLEDGEDHLADAICGWRTIFDGGV